MLAHAGIGSRRACEDFITQGRVTINGKVVKELGTKVLAGRDRVVVDGQAIHDERPAYIAVNKPKGYVSTNNDPSGRPRVVDLVPNIPQRVYTVGRLDEMSTGLMLLTNDGELANKLAHPKFGVEKVYRAVVAGTPDPEVFRKLVEGVWIAEGKVRAQRVRPIAHKGDATVLEMVLAEGKNREVRRMLAKLGHKVMTLTRVAVGPVTLQGLKPGGWRFLTGREVDLLRRVGDGLPVPTGRFGNDRPMRPPTRGPRAYQAGRPPVHERSEELPRDRRSAQGGPARPPARAPYRPAQGGPPRAPYRPAQGGPPRPPYRPAEGGPPRPPARAPYRPAQDGPPRPPMQADRRPYGNGEDGPRARPPGRPEGRPPIGNSQGGRPSRPPYRPDGPPQGGPPRPRLARLNDDGPNPAQRPPAPRPSGPPQAGRPPYRPTGNNAGRPVPPRPMPPRPARDEPPPRRIIGMDGPQGGPENSSRRPMPRRRPEGGSPPPPRRAPKPIPPRRRRPLGGSDE